MSARQKAWARKARAALIEEMGGRCWNPACEEPYGFLEFDHIDPRTRTWKCHRTDSSATICRYRKEWREQLIQLLCPACNEAKGMRTIAYPKPNPNEPF